MSTGGEVANALVCKTSIRGFDPLPVLHNFKASHFLRHSYRSWLDATGAAPDVIKDPMRHSSITTTFNVYGKSLSPEMREANNRGW
jgi:integrase